MALRHLILFILFTYTLHAIPQDYKACQLKYQVSSINIDRSKGFAIDKDYVLFYSPTAPKEGLIKRDPFLGLNLVKSPKPFKHLFKFYANHPKKLASILPEQVTEGDIRTRQIGLEQLAHFSKPTEPNALISGTCCGIVGLGTSSGIIEKAYIQHFLESKKIVYADAGIRVQDNKGVRVIAVNPFFESSPFLLDDVILSMDKTPVTSASELSKKILFSRPQSTHAFAIERQGKRMKVEGIFKERLSGGLIPESFFELFGVRLGEDLSVKEGNDKLELKVGDQVLSVMRQEVRTLQELRALLSSQKGNEHASVELLIRRNGFDFFIHIPKP